jgi:hypothetical protein
LTEYGLLKHKDCEKYILDDDEDQDGAFYHSGIDGSLFTPKYEKFYGNNEYCTDLFSFEGEEPQVSNLIN